MRLFVALLLAATLLGACAPDDQEFDISSLIPRHQAAFRLAAGDLNLQRANIAHFTFSDDARSFAHYSEITPGTDANTILTHLPTWIGWEIRFSSAMI